ncbi:hypothetical protein [Thiohalomonas denitrificans]|uniref:Uncharacterized protein n=1 Tax=Thiohalomonas denitrificans TaxID=415747 RepID=A0A1G5PU96_9GAMM|nr:hypothetical protein [Thiohalomonas denitrificans]SCZ53002.1 hypothetical protein SAMN03097708_00848 [Thiohalomonas denitrificans]
MEIDNDLLERKAHLYEPRRLPTTYLILVLAAGVAIGNGITALAGYAWLRIEIQLATMEMQKQAEKATARFNLQAEQTRARNLEREHQKAQAELKATPAYQNAYRICEFWRQQAAADDNAFHRQKRAETCAKLNDFQ